MYSFSSTSSVSQTASLDAFVNAKPTSQLSYYYLSLLEKDTENNIEYDVYNIISDYLQDLKKMCTTITLSDKEYYTYRFRPKLISKSDLSDALSSINSSEKSFIDTYNESATS